MYLLYTKNIYFKIILMISCFYDRKQNSIINIIGFFFNKIYIDNILKKYNIILFIDNNIYKNPIYIEHISSIINYFNNFYLFYLDKFEYIYINKEFTYELDNIPEYFESFDTCYQYTIYYQKLIDINKLVSILNNNNNILLLFIDNISVNTCGIINMNIFRDYLYNLITNYIIFIIIYDEEIFKLYNKYFNSNKIFIMYYKYVDIDKIYNIILKTSN